MLEPVPQPMSVEAFFAWQERTMAGVRNVHDDLVVTPRLVQDAAHDAPPGGTAL